MEDSTPSTAAAPSLSPSPSNFSPEQYILIQICTRCSAVLSVLGSFAIIMAALLDPRTKLGSTPKRLIVYLAITDFVGSIFLALSRAGFTLHGPESDLCKAQGFFVQFTVLASVAWTTAVAAGLVLSIVFNQHKAQLLRWEWFFLFLCWGVTFFLSILFLFPQLEEREGKPVYGAADLWCWITSEYKDYRMYLFYIPLWISFFVILVCYVAVGLSLRKSARNLEKGGLESADLRMLNRNRRRYALKTSSYLFAFFCCWFPATINRIFNQINPQEKVFALFLVHATMVPLSGFLNSVIYFWSNICYQLSSSPSPSLSLSSSIPAEREGTRSGPLLPLPPTLVSYKGRNRVIKTLSPRALDSFSISLSSFTSSLSLSPCSPPAYNLHEERDEEAGRERMIDDHLKALPSGSARRKKREERRQSQRERDSVEKGVSRDWTDRISRPSFAGSRAPERENAGSKAEESREREGERERTERERSSMERDVAQRTEAGKLPSYLASIDDAGKVDSYTGAQLLRI